MPHRTAMRLMLGLLLVSLTSGCSMVEGVMVGSTYRHGGEFDRSWEQAAPATQAPASHAPATRTPPDVPSRPADGATTR